MECLRHLKKATHFPFWWQVNSSRVFRLLMTISSVQMILQSGAKGGAPNDGFSLVELLVSMAVFAAMLGIISSAIDQSILTVQNASAQINASQAGRAGFDIMTQKLSQATLGTYWDYDSPTAPTKYIRKSDLHFIISGTTASKAVYFQAPLAISESSSYAQTQGLLNACGYFVQFGNDDNFRPRHVSQKRYRYRLMQGVQTTENLTVLNGGTNSNWTNAVTQNSWPIYDNVIALILWPRISPTVDVSGTSLSTNYQYDSRSTDANKAIQWAQLPPLVQVTMIVIDEATAARLDSGATPPAVIESALQGKFTDVTSFQSDLDQLENSLKQAHINYKTLNTSVLLSESKWSSNP